jgi:pimeloyl-ACP methyl ester carboxylesterase
MGGAPAFRPGVSRGRVGTVHARVPAGREPVRPAPTGAVPPAPGGAGRQLTWGRVTVDGAAVRYAACGDGPPALFLHGWGLRPDAYARAIEAMAAAGCRVYAPALPGFGGTRELEPHERSFAGYGLWVDRFAGAVLPAEEPCFALVAGHSFGGGVATAFAHACPDRCRGLLLANAVGSPVWARYADELLTMVERPLWDWCFNFGADVLRSPRAVRTLVALLGDVVPNLVRNPLGLVRTSTVVRRADLVHEVAAVAAQGTPVVVSWSDRDRLVPRSAFDDIRRAADVEGIVVEGSHAWLVADPAAFGELAIMALAESGASLERPRLRSVRP